MSPEKHDFLIGRPFDSIFNALFIDEGIVMIGWFLIKKKEVPISELTDGTEPQNKLQRSLSLNIFWYLRTHDRTKPPVSNAPVLFTLVSRIRLIIYQIHVIVIK